MKFHDLRLDCLKMAAAMAAGGRLAEREIYSKANEFVDHILSAPTEAQAARLKEIAKTERAADEKNAK